MDILKLDIPDRLSLFKLPNTSNSKGFFFGDWKEQFWEGGLKIFESNDKLVIKFFKDGKQYTQLVVPDKYEEAIIKCEDSVRGFAIRLNNPNGGYTWLGLGFRDRNSAFDFRSRIIDFCERNNEDTTQAKVDFNQVEDYSLKKGEKISFSLGGPTKEKTSSQAQNKSNQGNFVFEMPNQGNTFPNTTNTLSNTTNTAQSSSSSNNNNWDTWNFGSANTTTTTNSNQNQQNDFFGDFSDFSNFGGKQQQQQPQQQQQQQWGFGGNQNQGQPQGFGGSNQNADQWSFGSNQQQQQQQQQQYAQMNYSNNIQQQTYQNNNNNNQNKQPANTIDLLDL